MTMETDQLIEPSPPITRITRGRSGSCWRWRCSRECRFRWLMFLATLGVRPDVMTAMHNPFFDLKFLVTLALAISAIAIGLHLSRPEASLRGWGWLLLIPAGLLAVGIGAEMMMPQRLPMMTR